MAPTDRDRQDRAEQPGPELAEVVDERHDRLVAGPRRPAGCWIGCRGKTADTRLEQGVGIGHGRGARGGLAGDRRGVGRGRGGGRAGSPVARQRAACRRAAATGATGSGGAPATGATGATGRRHRRRRGRRRRGGRLGRRQRRRVDVDRRLLPGDPIEAFRNSRMLLPSDGPTSGSLPGPRMRSAITRMMTSSGGPGVGMIVVCSCEKGSWRSSPRRANPRASSAARLG